MDGFKQTYKQGQSFGLSTEPLGNYFPNRNNFPRYDSNMYTNFFANAKINSEYVQTDSIVSVGSVISTFRGVGVLAPNDKIYFPPAIGTSITVFDPKFFTTISIGSGLSSIIGGCLWKDFIFFPHVVNNLGMVKVNWITNQVSIIRCTLSGENYGCCMSPNGLIYYFPKTTNTVAFFDPVSETFGTFGSINGGTNFWLNGCIHPDGNIYCAPSSSSNSNMLVIDTIRHSVSTIPSLTTSGGLQWHFGSVSQYGDIYFTPRDGADVLKYSPSTRSFKKFGSLGTATNKFAGSVLAPNGFIYASDYNGTVGMMKIDPLNDVVSTFGATGTVTFFGAVLHTSGKLFCGGHSGADQVRMVLSNVGEIPFNQCNNRFIKCN